MFNGRAVGCFVAACAAVALAGPVLQGRQAGDRPGEKTVILGTWSWDIESNGLEPNNGTADLFWEQVTKTEQNLVPQNGAGLAVLKKQAFDKVTRGDLAGLKYSTKKIPGTDLTPGTVLALRTAEGNLAKLKVVGRRALHDFTFPEARHLKENFRAFVLQQPDQKDYHLEVEWVLYQK